MAAIIIGAIMILGYVIISSFLGSDEGQTIQDTANKVIDTIESSSTE
jgi:ABC-type spermidine/putrescine transport system permease subunit I